MNTIIKYIMEILAEKAIKRLEKSIEKLEAKIEKKRQKMREKIVSAIDEYEED